MRATDLLTPHPPPAKEEDSRTRPRWRTVWISDVHLGTRESKADLLAEFLRGLSCERLYLLGDIVDGWRLSRSWRWGASHRRVVDAVLALRDAGTRICWVIGNHDAFLMPYLGRRAFGILLRRKVVHRTADGRRLLVLHGDQLDARLGSGRLLARMGSQAYAMGISLDGFLWDLRSRWGQRGHGSVVTAIKWRLKSARAHVAKFERAAAELAREGGFDGVVCGHVHRPELRRIDGVLYANDGDWVEHATALVEDPSGQLELLVHDRAPRTAMTTRHLPEAVP